MRAATASTDPPLTLARMPVRLRSALSRLRVTPGRISGRVAVATLIVSCLAVVATAAAGPSILVPRSVQTFPSWEAGPLSFVTTRLILNGQTLGFVFSGVVAIMIVAYFVALGALRTLSMKTIAITVVALHVILLMSPPLQLTDVFNYLGYARLGALHELNPYTHGIKLESFDPVYRFTSWRDLRSPYGPLFTALTYPLAFMSLPLAYWTLKIITVAMSLVFVGLVYLSAKRLGRDPRFAVAFVALNPIFLIYEVGGFHNDFFMLVPTMAAILFVISRRWRWAGALLTVAIAVKFTAVLLLPFLLVAAHSRRHQLRVLIGAALAAIPLAGLSVALFGLTIPNLSQQSSLLTDFSIPNVVGWLLHLGGGTPLLLKAATVCVVLVVAHQFLRNRDWLSGAGWATFALIASLAWLVPWYVVWLLPLAALGTSTRLRTTALVLTVYLVLSFIPATGWYLSAYGINPLATPAGQASKSLQHKLAS